MITAEMRIMMAKEQMINDLEKIKKEIAQLKADLATLREMICPTLN